VTVALNIDLGELPGEPEALYACAHIANVACGGHAGDDVSMDRAVALCLAHGARLGVHPSYPDREGFGRRARDMPPAAIATSVAEQCARLVAVARARGAVVSFAKAHGALYHAAHRDPAIARAVARGVQAAVPGPVTLIGPAGGAIADAARSEGLAFAREAFADRATRPDGSLVPRGEPGAVIVDEADAVALALALAARGDVDTVCLHGDAPGAVGRARAVRAALDRAASG
jgi:5-oxoprolinase (ATP-hydrolysing) subunit A